MKCRPCHGFAFHPSSGLTPSKLLHPFERSPHLSAMSIGFKEWTLICEALGNGSQSIILRKGGIAEGRAGFRFQHDEFFLFPPFSTNR
jgi:hypothetical protein